MWHPSHAMESRNMQVPYCVSATPQHCVKVGKQCIKREALNTIRDTSPEYKYAGETS